MPQLSRPVFTISVAANLVGVSPQTLRRWERVGLLSPLREGPRRLRLYSWRDIERAQEIRYLVVRKRLPLKAVRAHLRLAAARRLVAVLPRIGSRPGTPLAPPIALAIPR
jgi:DNA-binding transcriptional MerR regulator